MIYITYQLKAKLDNLVLAGQNCEGELEFIGAPADWLKAEREEDLLASNLDK